MGAQSTKVQTFDIESQEEVNDKGDIIQRKMNDLDLSDGMTALPPRVLRRRIPSIPLLNLNLQ